MLENNIFNYASDLKPSDIFKGIVLFKDLNIKNLYDFTHEKAIELATNKILKKIITQYNNLLTQTDVLKEEIKRLAEITVIDLTVFDKILIGIIIILVITLIIVIIKYSIETTIGRLFNKILPVWMKPKKADLTETIKNLEKIKIEFEEIKKELEENKKEKLETSEKLIKDIKDNVSAIELRAKKTTDKVIESQIKLMEQAKSTELSIIKGTYDVRIHLYKAVIDAALEDIIDSIKLILLKKGLTLEMERQTEIIKRVHVLMAKENFKENLDSFKSDLLQIKEKSIEQKNMNYKNFINMQNPLINSGLIGGTTGYKIATQFLGENELNRSTFSTHSVNSDSSKEFIEFGADKIKENKFIQCIDLNFDKLLNSIKSEIQKLIEPTEEIKGKITNIISNSRELEDALRIGKIKVWEVTKKFDDQLIELTYYSDMSIIQQRLTDLGNGYLEIAANF